VQTKNPTAKLFHGDKPKIPRNQPIFVTGTIRIENHLKRPIKLFSRWIKKRPARQLPYRWPSLPCPRRKHGKDENNQVYRK